MKPFRIAAAALAVGAVAVSGAAQAHAKKHKHRHHHRPVAERVVIKRVYVTGERLPSRYYANRVYYVRPSLYSLPPAPYGYEYVRVGNQVYLTQTETGLISQVISNLIR